MPGGNIRAFVIVHDPYSSTEVFDDAEFVIDPAPEIDLVTAWHVPRLFLGDQTISAKYSRLCCDVGRTRPVSGAHAIEQGAGCTRTLDGRRLRGTPSQTLLDRVDEIDRKHHFAVADAIEKCVSYLPVWLLSAQSFNDLQAERTGNVREASIPDICLGYSEPEAPTVILLLQTFFETHGLQVGLNAPFSGSMQSDYHAANKEVGSLVIAVHKRLYLKDVHRREPDIARFAILRGILDGAIRLIGEHDRIG